MNHLNFILLQEAQPQGGGMSGFIMIIAMVVIFYFFMIRPQSKKQKELKKAREAMKKGDKVVTAGGIHGKVKDLTDTIVNMEIAPGVTIKVDKTSVFAIPTAAPASNAKADKKAESKEKAGDALNEMAGKVSKSQKEDKEAESEA